MTSQTPAQYAKQEVIAARFPQISIEAMGGAFAFRDGEGNFLNGPHYATKQEAEQVRSKVLDKAHKFIGAGDVK